MNKIVVFGNTLQNTMGLIRSIGKAGYSVDLILEPGPKGQCFVRWSKYLGKVTYLEKTSDAIDVLLKEYGNEPNKTIVFCGSDPTISMLDANYNRLKNKFYVFNAKDEQGRINRYLDKLNTFEIAERCGLPLIKTWNVTDIHYVPSDIPFPCFVKGNNSVKSGKWDIKICQNREELLGFLREGVNYLVQEFIVKDYEISLTGFSTDHGSNVLIPGVIRKVREDLVRMGEYMRLDDTSAYPMVNYGGIKKLIKEIGYEGIFSVDMLVKEDKAYFLEVNLRNDGLAYMYTAAGANYPKMWIKYLTGTLSDGEIAAIKLRTPFFLMHENDMYNIVEGKVGIWQWIKDFRRSDAFFVLDKEDPMPFIYSTWIHFKQLCKKIFRKLGVKI